MRLNAVAYLSCCSFFMFHTMECIVFKLEDHDLNRVIIVGESNIVMTCSASEVSNPQYEIKHEGVIVDNQPFFRVTTTGESVEVTITQVQNTHGGEYECLVTGGGMMIVSNLTLDVRDPFTEGGVYCPQSGETLTADEGDSLSLFCYFSWAADNGNFTSRDFVWQLINGSTLVPLDSTIVTRSPNFFKGLAEVLLGPLTTEDSGTEYQCYHPTEHRSGNKPCFVGPVIVMHTAVNVSTPVSHSSSAAAPTAPEMDSSNGDQSVTAMPRNSQTSVETTFLSSNSIGNNMTSNAMTSDDSQTIIIILACVACIIVVTFLAIFVCLIFLCRKGQKDEEDQKQENQLEPMKTYSSDPQNGYLEAKSAMKMSSAESDYEGVVSNPGPSGRMGSVEQNLATYDKVNHNPLFSRTNGQKQSDRKYDDAPVGIPEGLERSTLYGKQETWRENSDSEEDFSDLYRKIDKTASLGRYSKRDEEDAGLY